MYPYFTHFHKLSQKLELVSNKPIQTELSRLLSSHDLLIQTLGYGVTYKLPNAVVKSTWMCVLQYFHHVKVKIERELNFQFVILSSKSNFLS